MKKEAILQLMHENLRSLRKTKGLTQKQLGERAGFPATYINKVETGRANPTIDSLVRIVVALNEPMLELFLPNDVTQMRLKEKLYRMQQVPDEDKNTVEKLIEMAIRQNLSLHR